MTPIIKTESPLAYDLFKHWLQFKYRCTLQDDDPDGAQVVYDLWRYEGYEKLKGLTFPLPDQFITEFLDLRGIVVSQWIERPSGKPCQFRPCLFHGSDAVEYLDLFPDRPTAFQAGTTKAFSLLNSQLQENTNAK